MKTSQPLVKFGRWLPAAAIVALVFSASAPAWANSKMYQDALPSTTWVLAKDAAGKTLRGTGVLVDSEKKLVVTNFSNIGDARTAFILFPAVIGEKTEFDLEYYKTNLNKLAIKGRVVAVDRKRDLALVQLEKLPEAAKAITMATASTNPGEKVASISNPSSSDALWVYTEGTVRSVYRKKLAEEKDRSIMVVETQAAINTGESGGPVINEAGELVAIAPSTKQVSYSVDIGEVRVLLASPWKSAPVPVTDLLTEAKLEYTAHSTGDYQVEFEQDDKSKQTVFISKDTEFYGKADNRKIWALAAKLKESPKIEVVMKLLDQNGRTKLGSWTIEQSGKEVLVIYMAKLDATAASDSVKSTMEYVGKLTTIMKKELAPSDTKTAADTGDKLDDWLK